MSFSALETHLLYDVIVGYHVFLGSAWLFTFSQTFLVYDDFDSFEVYWSGTL